MNTKTLRPIAIAALLYAYVSSSPPVLACHSQANANPTDDACTGNQALGDDEDAIDLWTLTCPSGTVRARARVWDRNPVNNPAVLRVRVYKNGSDNEKDVDPDPDGEGEGPSSRAVRSGAGMGEYIVTYSQTNGGGEGYRGEARCYDGGDLDDIIEEDVTFIRVQNG